MAEAAHYEVVLVLLRQGDTYYLQLRNGAKQSGALGFVGGFGGAIEPGETPEEAACRETAEESSVHLEPNALELLGEVSVLSEKHGVPSTVHAIIYCAEVSESEEITALEGELVKMSLAELRDNIQLLSPVLRACVNELFREEN